MALAIKRIKAYLKLGAILLVLVLVLIVILENRLNTARVWFFWIDDKEPINVLWLILVTAAVSIVGWWSVRKIFKVLREVREVQRQAEAERQLNEQRRLAQELAEREKRIDAKVRRSLSEEGESP